MSRKKAGKKIAQFQEDTIRSQLTEMSQISSPRKGKKLKKIDQIDEDLEGSKGNKKTFTSPQIYRKFFKYTLNRWKFGIVILIITILSGVVSSIFPYQLGVLVDIVSKQTDNNKEPEKFRQILISSMIQLTGVTILIAVTNFLRFTSLKIFQQKLGIDLRKEVYTLFMGNDLNFFEIYKTGELISRLSGDINQAKSAISNNLTFLLRNVITIVGSVTILFLMSWKLTFIVLTIVPVYAFVTMQYTRKAKILVRKKQDVEAEISVHIGQKFSGIQTIKAYCAQNQEIDKYMQSNMNSYEITKLRTLYEGIHNTCSTFLPSFGALLVLLYAGARLLSKNVQLSAGQLTSFILYCNNLANTTAGISNSYTNIINGTSAIQKVFEMMNYERLVVEDVGRQVAIDGNVEFKNVQFKYPQAQAPIFKDLSFSIKSGEYVAFVGQSGSGKSTITKLIQHFYRIQKGDIIFGNQNTSELNVKHIRSQIGLVSQEATIFSGTIEQNITYGLKDFSVDEMEKAAEKAGCMDFINNKYLFPHGFQTTIGQRGINLSGGQRQRISIARALIRKPKILIFDEATSALDSNSEHLVQQSIEELANDRGITIIVVAHRLSTVIKCDRLYVMKEGEIIETGPHRDLIKQKGYYYHLIQKQLHEDSSFVDEGKNQEVPYSDPQIPQGRKSDEATSSRSTKVISHS